VIYTVFAAGILLLRGGTPERVGAIALLGLYLMGGIVGGLIVGLFRPWLKYRACSTAVGILALIPMSLGALRLMAGPIAGWGGAEWFAVFGTATLLGGYFGYDYWDLQHFDPLTGLTKISPPPSSTKPRSKGQSGGRKSRPSC
jgi:hypothetical protein